MMMPGTPHSRGTGLHQVDHIWEMAPSKTYKYRNQLSAVWRVQSCELKRDWECATESCGSSSSLSVWGKSPSSQPLNDRPYTVSLSAVVG